MEVVPHKEGFFAADHARCFQFGGNLACGRSALEQHKLLPARRDWRENSPREPAAKRECQQQQKCQKPSQVSVV